MRGPPRSHALPPAAAATTAAPPPAAAGPPRPPRTATHTSSLRLARLDAQMSLPRASAVAVLDTPWYSRPSVHGAGAVAFGCAGRRSVGGGRGGAPGGGGGSVASTRRTSSRGAPMRAIRETSCHMVWRRYEEVGGGRWRAGGECGSASETLCEAGPFLEVVAITHEIQFRTPYKSISIHCNNNQDYRPPLCSLHPNPIVSARCTSATRRALSLQSWMCSECPILSTATMMADKS